MRNYSAKNVDEYIASASREAQAKLRDVRTAIRAVVPKADESISWGVPFYRQNGLLAGFSAGKSHILFGLVAVLSAEIRRKLEESGYSTGKKTIRIKFDQKVPVTAIKQILIEQVKNNESKKLD